MGPEEATVARRLAAIFAADVASYSRLMGEDEAGTMRALSSARATLDRVIADYGGRIANTAGDSVLAEFASAVDAVKCAIAVQKELAEADDGAGGPRLAFRIAVHVGDVMPSGTDIFGDGVNVCARLQELAEPGGICISGAAHQYVRKTLKVAFDDLGEKSLKNIEEPVRVFAIRSAPRPQPTTTVLAWARITRLNFVLVGALAVVVAIFSYQQLSSYTAPNPQNALSKERAAGAISIAVLPFTNLSGDSTQEFFSDGMTEEITSALAKVPDLRVVARTSAFEFKGKNVNIKTVGGELGATHLIEGSVRKAGERVRITAELVKADNGVTIWTESYDRQLTDVFAIQEDIAHAVATSLHVALGLKPGEALAKQRPRDPALHDQYLRARNLVRTRRAEPTAEAIRLLNDVVTRDPGYAPAWAVLAQAYAATLLVTPEISFGMTEQAKPIIQGILPKIEAAAEQAIKLDPNTAEAYCALGGARTYRGDRIAAMELRQRGLAIDPDYPDCLNNPEILNLGFVKQALPIRDHLLAVEPLVPVYRNVTARVLFADGQYDAAIAMLNSLPGRGTAGNPLMAQIYAAQGRYREAADLLAAINSPDPAISKLLATAARLLRNAPAAAPPDDRPELGFLNWVYVYAGAPERFMNTYDRVGYNMGVAGGFQWAPAYHSIRQTERFKKWIRDSGIYAYWRAKGWPPQCHPTSGDDFVCN